MPEPTARPARRSELADPAARPTAAEAGLDAITETLEEAFAGRRGHGGGPCLRRSLTQGELSELLGKCLLRFTRKLQDRAEPRS